MSPKRRVAIFTGIFAAVGVGVSVAIIAAGGGFTTGASPFDPPTQEDIWVVGSNIQDGTMLEYSLDAMGPESRLESAEATISFEDAGENWNVNFVIANGTGQQAIEHTMVMSKQLTRDGQLDASFRPYFDPLQSSILAVRDWEYGDSPKYLVIGAPWQQIFYQSSQVIVRVTGQETVQTPAGSFDAFVLTYKLAEKESRIWVARDMPLPVKAEVYDFDDSLQYRYELVSASGVESPSASL